MKALRYSLETAFKSIWRDKWLNLLTVLSITIGLSILCSFTLVTLNVDSALKRWSKSFGMVVYLNDDLSTEEKGELQRRFDSDKEIVNAVYKPSDQALIEVRDALGENALLLDIFDTNPLPSSFELNLRGDILKPGLVRSKAAEIEAIQAVKEVQYGEQWLSSLNTIATVMKIAALLFGAAIFIAITFITYSTIKIFFYRRKEDVETMKLLGAPRSFIRLPFLIEGLCIGAVGGVLSAAALFGIYSFTASRIVEFLPSVGMIVTSIPLILYAVVPLAGAFMSFMGSLIAVGKLRY